MRSLSVVLLPASVLLLAAAVVARLTVVIIARLFTGVFWRRSVISVFALRFVFSFFLLVEACDVVLTQNVAEGFFLCRFGRCFAFESQRFFAGFVEGYDFECAVSADGYQVGGDILVGGVGDLSLEDVCLEVEICRIGCLETRVARRHAF